MEKEYKTICNQQSMFGFYIMLASMLQELNTAYEKASNAKQVFDEGYHGEAEQEIDLFLTSLPMHIYRLAIFYQKLMEFVQVTAEAFLQNDMKMAEKMEEK